MLFEPKQPCIYIMANRRNGTIYTGVAGNLSSRAYQHREGNGSKFTKKYHCKTLVYYEHYETMNEAITREKQIKSWKRYRKLKLIESVNPHWKDLYEELNL